jgi:AdoMet-dependent rRNA methyltransferase SPB1
MGYGDSDGLPKWFLEEEKQHCRASLPVTKELVERYKAKMREINERPTKKVAEAKGRKKRRVGLFNSLLFYYYFVFKELRKLEKVKRKAEPLLENADLDDKERNKQIKE